MAKRKLSDIIKLSIWKIRFGNFHQDLGYSNAFKAKINADFPSSENTSMVIEILIPFQL